MRRSRNRKKTNKILLLITLLLSIGLGYALLTQNLTIDGVTKVRGNTWDIHFENLVVSYDSVSLSEGDSTAVIDPVTRTRVDCVVTLRKPGDMYSFWVDAVNAGTVDGMIESTPLKMNGETVTTLPPYLSYSVTYHDDNTEIINNHILEAGESETIRVTVVYRDDIDPSDLPTSEQTITLSFEANYIQADRNAIRRFETYYMTFGTGPKSTVNSSWPYYVQGRGKITGYYSEDLYILLTYNGDILVNADDDGGSYYALTECQALEGQEGSIRTVCSKVASAGEPYYGNSTGKEACVVANNGKICVKPDGWDCEYNEGTCENENSYIMQKKNEAEALGFNCTFTEDASNGGPAFSAFRSSNTLFAKKIESETTVSLNCTNNTIGFKVLSNGTAIAYENDASYCIIDSHSLSCHFGDYANNAGGLIVS